MTTAGGRRRALRRRVAVALTVSLLALGALAEETADQGEGAAMPSSKPVEEFESPIMPAPGLKGDVVSLRGHLLGENDEARCVARRDLEELVYAAGMSEGGRDELVRALLGLLKELQDSSPVIDASGIPDYEGLAGFLSAFVETVRDEANARMRHQRAVQARRDVTYWLGLVAMDAHVPGVAALLEQEDVANEALAALERVPGEAAASALLQALESSDGALRVGVIAALGRRGFQEAVPKLTALAREAPPETAWACLDALARLGVTPNRVFPRNPSFTPEEDARYAHAALTAAHALEANGQTKEAVSIYTSFTELYAKRYQVRAALLGLERAGSDRVLRFALGYLNTLDVRETAIGVLARLRGAGVEDKLFKAFQVTDPSMKAGILHVLARRKASSLAALLGQADVSGDPGLRFTSALLRGEVPHEKDLLWLAERGAPWYRNEAVDLYLDLAHSRAISGDTMFAAAQFREILTRDFSDSVTCEAIEGLGHLARQEDQPLVERFTRTPGLDVEAQKAVVRIVSAMEDHGKAKEELLAIAQSAPPDDVLAIAVEELAKFGVDSTPYAKRRGYVTRWLVLGPFPGGEDRTLDTPYFHEQRGDAAESVEYEEKVYQWREAEADGLPAILDLDGESPGNTAYGHTRILSSVWKPAELHIGCEGGLKVWLNGKEIYRAETEGPLQAGEHRIPVVLSPAINRILVKVLQSGTGGRYCVRLTDRRGQPLDLSKQKLPDDGLRGIGLRAGAAVTSAAEDMP